MIFFFLYLCNCQLVSNFNLNLILYWICWRIIFLMITRSIACCSIFKYWCHRFQPCFYSKVWLTLHTWTNRPRLQALYTLIFVEWTFSFYHSHCHVFQLLFYELKLFLLLLRVGDGYKWSRHAALDILWPFGVLQKYFIGYSPYDRMRSLAVFVEATVAPLAAPAISISSRGSLPSVSNSTSLTKPSSLLLWHLSPK